LESLGQEWQYFRGNNLLSWGSGYYVATPAEPVAIGRESLGIARLTVHGFLSDAGVIGLIIKGNLYE